MIILYIILISLCWYYVIKQDSYVAFAIAISSFVISYIVASAFKYGDWSHYACLALVDLLVLWLIAGLPMFNLRKRYMSCVIFIMILLSAVSAIILYIYEFYDNSLFDYMAFNLVDTFYSMLTFTLSALMLWISITPKRTLGRLNDRCWPSALSGIYSCNITDCKKDSEKGI